MPARRPLRSPRPAPRRGAATLIVVMVLFFLVSLVAAYTSRNMIFEQKTSANQVRSSQAFETAEAGLEWAVAQLNAGLGTAQCVPSTSTTDQALRERYLDIDPATGLIAVRAASGGGSVQPSCVFDTSDPDPTVWRWSCRCPAIAGASAALTPPATTHPAPAFALRFCNASAVNEAQCTSTTPLAGARPGVIRLEVNGCTRLEPTCLAFGTGTAIARGEIGEGVASVSAVIALRSAIASPPAAALTLRGQLQPAVGGSSLTVTNSDGAVGAVTVQSGGGVDRTGLTLVSMPGTPGDRSVIEGDASLVQGDVTALSLPGEDRFFVGFFGMRPETYQRQPAVLQIDCSTACDAAAVNAVLDLNPGRMLWLTGAGGGLTVDADIGSATRPALIVVEGDLTLTGPATFTGLLYGRKAAWAWTVSGAPAIVGAVLAEGNLQLSGASTPTITYDGPLLARLRTTHGSFVRVPGGWRDFAPN